MNHCWYWWLSIHNNRINIIFYLEKILQRQHEWSTILSTFIWYIMNTGKYISYDSLNKQQQQQSFKKCHVGAPIPCVCAFIAVVEPFHMFFSCFIQSLKVFQVTFPWTHCHAYIHQTDWLSMPYRFALEFIQLQRTLKGANFGNKSPITRSI